MSVAAQGDVSLQAAAGSEIASLVQAGAITAADSTSHIATAVLNQDVSADQGYGILLGMAVHGDTATASDAIAEMGAVVQPTAAVAHIDDAVTAHAISGTQAMGVLIDLAAAAASPGDQAAIAGEIDSLVGQGYLTAAQAAVRIIDAVGSTLTANQAVALFAHLAVSDPTPLQVVAAHEIAHLVNYGQISISDVGTDVAAALTPDQTVTVLAQVAAHTAAAERPAIGEEIAGLIDSNQISIADALNDIGLSVSTGVLSGAAAGEVMTGLAAAGLAEQSAVGGALASLVAANHLSSAAAVSVVANSVATQVLSVDDVLAVLASFAGAGTSTARTQVDREIAALVGNSQVTAPNAVADLANAAGAGTANVQAAVGGEIAWLVRSNLLAIPDAVAAISTACDEGVLTADQLIAVLVSFAAASTPVAQTLAGGEIASLVMNSPIDPAQALADVGSAVSTGRLTADQAIKVLAGAAAGGDAYLQVAVGDEIASMIIAAQTTVARAVADIRTALSSDVLTADQAVIVLSALASAQSAFGKAASGQLVSMITHGQITAAGVAADIRDAVSAEALTGERAVTVLVGVAASAPATDLATVGAAIAALIAQSAAAASFAAADLDQAVATGGLSASRGAIVLANMAADDSAGPQVACAELAALVAANAISAGAAIRSITALIGSTITSEQAVPILGALASQGNATLQAQAQREMTTLLAASNGTVDQAIVALASQAVSASASEQAALGAQIAALITTGKATANHALADILVATAHGLGTDQAVALMMNVAAGGDASIQAAVDAEIGALVSSSSTARHVIGVLAALGAADNVALDNAVASTVLALVDAGHVSLNSALRTIENAVASGMGGDGGDDGDGGDAGTPVTSTGTITGSQAVAILASMLGVASNGTDSDDQFEIVLALGSMIDNGQVTATQGITAIAAAVAANQLSGDQAVVAIAIMASDQYDVPTEVAGGAAIVSLVEAGAITAAAAVADVVGLSGGLIDPSDAFGLLLGIAVSDNSAAAAVATAAMGSLSSPDQVVFSVGEAIAELAVTTEQGLGVLASLASTGDVTMQSAVFGELDTLRAESQVTADQIVTAMLSFAETGAATAQSVAGLEMGSLIAQSAISVDDAIAAVAIAVTSGVLSGSNAVGVLANLGASALPELQAAAAYEIASLIDASDVTATQAVTTLVESYGADSAATQGFAVAEIGVLIAAGQVTVVQAISGVADAATANGLTSAQSITLLGELAGSASGADSQGGDLVVAAMLGLVASGDGTTQSAASAALASLIAAGTVTANQIVADIGTAVAASGLTAQQTVGLLTQLATQVSDVQPAVVSELTSLIATNAIDATQATTALLGFYGGAGAEQQSVVAAEIGAVLAAGSVTIAQVLADAANASTSSPWSADQTIAFLAQLAGSAPSTVQASIGTQIAGLVEAGTITAAAAFSDIAATAPDGSGIDQAIALMMHVVASGGATLQSAADSEIAALVVTYQPSPDDFYIQQILANASQNWGSTVSPADAAQLGNFLYVGVSATQINADISGAVLDGQISAAQAGLLRQEIASAYGSAWDPAGSLTANQAVTILARLASTTDASLNTAVADTMWSLVAGGSTSTNALVNGIANAGSLSAPQEVSLALALAANIPNDAIGDLFDIGGLIGLPVEQGAMTAAQAAQDIMGAFDAAKLNAGQTATLLIAVANAASSDTDAVNVQVQTGSEIAALIGNGALATSDVVTIVDTLVGSNGTSITADVGFGVLLGMVVADQSEAGSVMPAMLGLAGSAGIMGDIDSAVTASAITADQAIGVLTKLAGAGDAAMLAAAAGEIYALVSADQIDAANAFADIATAVQATVLTPDQSIALLAGIAGHADITLQVSIGGEVAALVAADVLPVADAVAEIGAAVAAQSVTSDQAFNILLGAVISGSSSVASAAIAEILTLVQPMAATTNLVDALDASVITIGQAMDVLIDLAAAGTSTVQSAVSGGIAALIGSGQIAATQAMTDVIDATMASRLDSHVALAFLMDIAGQGDVAVQVAAGGDIATLVQAGLPVSDTIAAITNGVAAQAVTADQAVEVLLGIAAGNTAASDAAIQQVSMLASAGDAIAGVDNAVAVNAITAAQAVTLIVALATNGTTGMQVAAANAIENLVACNEITSDVGLSTLVGLAASLPGVQSTVIGLVDTMVSAGEATPGQGLSALIEVVSTDPTTQSMVAGEIVTLMAGNTIVGSDAMSAIGNAVPDVLTADQAISLMTAIAASTQAAAQAAGTEIAALITAGAIGADAAMTVMLSVAGTGTADTQVAVGTEINALIAGGQITASQAMGDVGAALAAGTIAVDGAIFMLVLVGASGDSTMQAAAGTEIAAFVTAGYVTGGQAIADISGATAYGVTSDAAVSVMVYAAGAEPALQGVVTAAILASVGYVPDTENAGVRSVIEELSTGIQSISSEGIYIASMIKGGLISTTTVGFDIVAAENAGSITPDEGVQLSIATDNALGYTSYSGPYVPYAPSNDHLVSLIVGLAAGEAGNGFGLSNAIASTVFSMINAGVVVIDSAFADVQNAASAGAITGSQAVSILAVLSGQAQFTTDGVFNAAEYFATYVVSTIAAVIEGGTVSPSLAMTTIGNAVLAQSISADQGALLLAFVGGAGDDAIQAAAGRQLATLLTSNPNVASDMLDDTSSFSQTLAAELFDTLQLPAVAAMIGGLVAPEIQAVLAANLAVPGSQLVADIEDLVNAGTVTAGEAAVVFYTVGIQAAGSANIAIQALAASMEPAIADLGPAASPGIGQLVAEQLITTAQGASLLLSLVGHGSGSDSLVAAEISSLISTGTITVGQAVSEINASIGSGSTVDQAVTLLSILSVQGNATLQSAANAEINDLIASGTISPAQALTDIGATVAAGALTSDQAVGLIATLAGAGAATLQVAAGAEIATLVGTSALSAAQAASDLAAGVTNQLLTVDQAIAILAGTAVAGDPATQATMIAAMSSLVSEGQVTAAQVVTDIANLAASNVNVDQVVALLAGVAGISTGLQGAAEAEVLAVIGSNQMSAAQAMMDIGGTVAAGTLTLDQAMSVFADLGHAGSASERGAIGVEVAALAASSQAVASQAVNDLVDAVAAGRLSADQAVTVLANAGAAAAASETIGVFVAGLTTLAGSGTMSAAQVAADIADAGLSADQATSLLAVAAVQGSTALQSAAAAEILSQISGNQITAAQAMSDIGATIAAGTLGADQVMDLLARLAGTSPLAVQKAIASEIASLVDTVAITTDAAFADLQTAIAAQSLSSDTAITLLAGVAAADATLQAAVVTEILALLAAGTVDAVQVATDLGTLIGSNLTGDQAIALFVGLWTQDNAALGSAVAAEIGTLVARGQLTAYQLANDLGTSIAGSALGPDQAIALLADIADAGSALTQAAVGQDIATLIAAGHIAVTQAIFDLDAAVTSGALTADIAIAVLTAMAAGASPTLQTAAAGEVAALVAAGALSATQSSADVANMIGEGVSADQAVAFLALLSLDPTLQDGVQSTILTLVESNVVTATSVMAAIGGTISSGTLTLDQASALIGSLANAGTSDVQTAAADAIAGLQGPAGIGQHITDGDLTASEGVLALIQLVANNPAQQSAVVAEISTLVAEGLVGATEVAGDVAVAINANFTADQAVSLLIDLAVTGNASLLGHAAATIVSLITDGQAGIVQVTQDVFSAVDTQWADRLGATFNGAGSGHIKLATRAKARQHLPTGRNS